MAEQFDRAEQRRTITEFDPVAKAGIFTDAFLDDYYRDSGAAQTAATNNGTLELAIEVVDRIPLLAAPVTLDFTEEVIVEQLLATSSSLVAPYLDYKPMPGSLKLAASRPLDRGSHHVHVRCDARVHGAAPWPAFDDSRNRRARDRHGHNRSNDAARDRCAMYRRWLRRR
ncbi:MAG: DUF4815 domain-containing protein [Tepidamorphaceae bacterium]